MTIHDLMPIANLASYAVLYIGGIVACAVIALGLKALSKFL
jgi:hypothetical protein